MPHAVIAGRRLEYRLTAPRVAGTPTVVFLHDGLGCLESWRDIPAIIAERTGCGTLTYSRWGYGGSELRTPPWPITFMHDEGRTVVPEVLLAFGLEDVVLFGHSDGGSMALIAGAFHSGLIRGIVTEAAHVIVESGTVAGVHDMRARYETGDLRSRLLRLHGDNTDAVFGGWSGVWLSHEMPGWTLRPLLPAISCPVLAIQGADDEYGTAAQVDTIAALSGGRVDTWMIDGCGHTPHREQPDAVIARVAAFVHASDR